jgi:uncharacterized RDD family membrane protein YckC
MTANHAAERDRLTTAVWQRMARLGLAAALVTTTLVGSVAAQAPSAADTTAQAAPAAPATPDPLPATTARRAGRAAAAQEPPVAPAPDPIAPEAVTPAEYPRHPCDGWHRDPMFRLGQDYTVRRDQTVDSAAAVYGNVLVEGHVCGDMSVTLGDARLARGSSVQGTLVVVAGTLTVEPGAAVDGELILVGGVLDAPADFRAGRGHVIIGIPVIGDHLRSFAPWLTRGLILGRLVVPDLAWVWWVVAVVLLVQLVINLLFPQATLSSSAAIAERPLSTFAAGVLVLILTVPVIALLAVTVVGIAALPVLFGGLLIAWVVGKIAVARWIGTRLVTQDEPESRLQSTRSFLIGAVVILLAYMVPVLGIVVWGLTGVLGLGAAAIAFMRAFRRENPPSPPRAGRTPVVPPVPPAVVTPPSAPYVGAEGGAPADYALNRAASTDAYTMPPPAFAGDVPPLGAAVPAAAAATDPRTLLAFPRAGFGERAAAFVLDALLVALVANALDLEHREHLVLLMIVSYHVGFWLWKATTLGGIICQLRVVRIDGGVLQPLDAVVRGVTAIFSLAAFGLGALWILRDPERQAWHDKVAGTYVVRVPRHYPT